MITRTALILENLWREKKISSTNMIKACNWREIFLMVVVVLLRIHSEIILSRETEKDSLGRKLIY